MSTLISAQQYKNITGLSTKKQGLYYAKKFNIKTNRRIKNANDRYVDFLDRLREKLNNLDNALIKKYVLDDEIFNINTRLTNKIILKNPLQTIVKNNALNKNRTFKVELTNKLIHYVLSNINSRNGKNLLIEVNSYNIDGPHTNIYTVNDMFLQSLLNDRTIETYDGLDEDYNIVGIKVYFVDKAKANARNEGAFFKHEVIRNEQTKKIEKILNKYQIYLEGTEINETENCLVHALKLTDLDNDIINQFKLKCKSSHIPMTAIRDLAITNKIKISVKKPNEVFTYGTGDEVIKIGLIDGHYFLNEEVEITKFSIDNFDEIKDQKDWWKISKRKIKNGKTYYEKNKKSGNDSFNMILHLLKSKLIKEITLNNKTLGSTNINKINIDEINLDNKDEEFDPIEPKKLEAIKLRYDDFYESIDVKDKEKYFDMHEDLEKSNYRVNIRIAFDFETITSNPEGHIPYLVCYCFYEGNEQISRIMSITGENCEKQLLDNISKYCYKVIEEKFEDWGISFDKDEESQKLKKTLINTVFNFTLFAHNITYDIQFLMKHVHNYKPIIRASNKVCGGRFSYKGLNFNLKDTYAIIDCKLQDFKEFFGLTIEKEVMPYELYTEDNLRGDKYVKIEEALKYLKKEDHDQFMKNLKKWDLIMKKDYFNPIIYAKRYCEIDIEVMMHGYFIFREWVLNDFKGIDIDNFLTASSIADEFFKLSGCYDGCNYISGISRYYIQKSVVGGRCMSRKNKMYDINCPLNDFDGVSLYPSAMKRLGEIGGYLRGTPMVLLKNQLNMNFLSKVDGYFIRIKLLNINKHRNFPLASFINKNGVRVFTNEFDETNNILSMNKILLEDLMKFQNVKESDFKIIDGYYFNQGRNNQITKTISHVFNLRNKFKAEGNPIQALYKLIMNSAYGKTIMKEQETSLFYADNEYEFNKKITTNYNHVVECTKLFKCDKYLVKLRKPINDHTNACHIGSEILAMSKRIMNEVMCLAEDNEIEIYYQDTDSMHIDNNSITKLGNLFKNKYGRDLIGKSLGQFHCDFEDINKKKALHTTRTIILGKKTYFDEVLYEDGSKHTHFRMKGIPKDVLSLKAKNKYNGNMKKLYLDLYNGTRINFDLLSARIKFNFTGDGNVKNFAKFKRNIYFERKKKEANDKIEKEDLETVFKAIE